MGPTGNAALLDSQQLTSAWVPQGQEFNPINGLGLSTAPQGPGAPPSLGYGSAYGLPPFGMGNTGNLGGTPPPGPPSRLLDGGSPN
ncbi:hypothetical protein C0995_009007 [Termitomyces sp. Mi166|nr:hypothetical protein C0995_009007 [Termitomyces sp. Mi166\